MISWLIFLGGAVTLAVPTVVRHDPVGDTNSCLPELTGVHPNRLKLLHETVLKRIYGLHQAETEIKPHPLEIIFGKDNENVKVLLKHYKAGHVLKYLTFNIYDDNMREASIALYRLFVESLNKNNFNTFKKWADTNINGDIVDYSLRTATRHTNRLDVIEFQPPFLTKPNYFVNSETILNILRIYSKKGKIDASESKAFQIFNIRDDVVTVNANYSRCNYDDKLDYFRKDIGLNGYYYGVQLTFPFWMNCSQLEDIDPNYTDKYYHIHRQLHARYNLEKEHLKQSGIEIENWYDAYVPNLIYENGLPFCSRSAKNIDEWYQESNKELEDLKELDRKFKGFIIGNLIHMIDNDTKVEATEDNYVNIMVKFLRGNFESVNSSKTIRNLFGCDVDRHTNDRYRPALSVLHHLQTTLRDPIYWYMIENGLKYFTDFMNKLKPADFCKYQNEDIQILDMSLNEINTFFDYFLINMEQFIEPFYQNTTEARKIYTARQKRLSHTPFSLKLNVSSTNDTKVLVKLFLGPQCQPPNCWDLFSQFYELTAFTHHLHEGLNHVNWSSENSTTYSYEDFHNLNLLNDRKNRYDIFKFPESLIIPRGLKNGLKLSLFIFIMPISYEMDVGDINEPLGFPLHKKFTIKVDTFNYKFYDINIYHKEKNTEKEKEGYYSTHLY